MPTEDEPITPRTPPSESIHASIHSCPPEERIEAHAPRAARIDSPLPGLEAIGPHETTQQPTPGPDARSGESESSRRQKRDEEDDSTESPSPVGSPERELDRVVRLVENAKAAASRAERNYIGEEMPTYLTYPTPLRQRRQVLPSSTSSFLYPGSKFRGNQQSDRQVYDVQVEIKDVDLAESFLCGYLRIQGLTDDHPTLTTFFTSEIIGPKHTFRTSHPSWNSSEKIDLQHWSRFPAFRPLARSAKSTGGTFTLKNNLEREHLFMRWKEYFLVPDHRVKSISGASFEGFYYICFDQRVGSVSGIYFHAKSEKFQQLELKHVGSGGCVGAVEFR